jgi:cytochrome b561
MHLRNGGHGYGLVTKCLHWLTVVLIAAQFVVGLTMSADDSEADLAEDQLAKVEDRREAQREADQEQLEQRLDRREEVAEGQGEAAQERFEEEADRLENEFEERQESEDRRTEEQVRTRKAEIDGLEDSDVSTLHIGLGLAVLALGLVRLLWRRATPLPPWAEHLSSGERRLESWLEKSLLALLLVVPATGLLLVVVGTDWLFVHVTAQLLLVAVIALHVGLVLKHTLLHRHGHLARMV